MENPHTSINDYISCNSNGNIINSSSPFNYQVDYNYSYLKHYIKKSFEEYCLKIKRGRPLPQYKYFREKYLKNLIKENKNNTKKLNIIKKIFNISFSYIE